MRLVPLVLAGPPQCGQCGRKPGRRRGFGERSIEGGGSDPTVEVRYFCTGCQMYDALGLGCSVMRLTFSNVPDAGTASPRATAHGTSSYLVLDFSVPAALPPANALLKRAIVWRSTAAPALKINLIEAFCDYFYPGLRRAHDEYPDVEDMLGMMEAAQDYDNVRGGGRGYRWRAGYIADARRQLTRLIGEFLWSFQRDEIFDKIAHMRNIVRKHKFETVFVTFNYDLLLETALTLERIDFSYAIDKTNTSRNIVLKPHGSINWFFPSENPKTKRWQGAHCLNFLDRIFVLTQAFPDFLNNGINPPYILIAPTPHKQIENEFLKRQWTSFSSSIHNAPNVTIVGYSLPAADRLARIVLRRGGPTHNVKKYITVIDPGELEDHYKRNISPRIAYVRDYCENYFG